MKKNRIIPNVPSEERSKMREGCDKKIIKGTFNTNNLTSLGGIMVITSACSNHHHFRNALIAGGIYILLLIILWLLLEYCKPFRNFFEKDK